MAFIHAHRHSEYSRLDGLGTAKQYAEVAAKMGHSHLAQTDHGTLSGALHHIEACRGLDKDGKRIHDRIIPISGVEAYFRPNRVEAKQQKKVKAWHLCLFAKNITGWRNLLALVSQAYSEVEDGGGWYDKPCVDWELLERYSEGLVCSTACVSSWLSHLVDLGHDSEVRQYVRKMRKIFGDDLWIEVMPHDFEGQRILNTELVSVANDYSVPLLATNDAHFPYKEWAETHRITKMMGSQSSFKQAEEDKKKGKATYLSELSPTLYLCSEEEMYEWFELNHPDMKANTVHEAIQNTHEFAKTFKPFMLDKSDKLPKVTESVEESHKILRQWIDEGMQALRDKYPADHWEQWPEEVYLERIETEWKVLVDKGVVDYFVMVGDIVRWCATTDPLPPQPGEKHNPFLDKKRKRPIRVGLGRGSAAGCLISYLAGIVKIDPVSYDLLFERFLNPNRKGLPDIDLDFQSDRRHEVKKYIISRYGQDHVADIITHQRFQPKNGIEAMMRVYDYPYVESRKVAATIDIGQDDDETTLEELTTVNDVLKELSLDNPEMWKHALRMEGTVMNAGKHASAVLVTPDPIVELLALERGKAGDLVTSWSDSADFAVISENGFVKIDTLGILGLTKHEYACALIKARTGEDIDLYALPALYNPWSVDEDVMDGFREGRTMGIFQFASRGITNLLKAIKPDNIHHIAACNALYRPGPMSQGMHMQFPKRKANPFLVKYTHKDLREWLGDTYGVIAFQEQVMRVSGGIGRLSPGDTDDMRKAMGKLYRLKGDAAQQFMERFRKPFYDGAILDHGWTEAQADEVWDLFLGFGSYGFNKSHSESYALQAYQDMWLKVHYPHEFFCAFLTHESGKKDSKDKQKAAVREARNQGIEVVPPDVNTAGSGYTTDGEVIRLGLTAIEGVGAANAKVIIKKRPFKSTEDFLMTKGIPHGPLIASGAADSIVGGLEGRMKLLATVNKEKRNGDIEELPKWKWVRHNLGLKKPKDEPKFEKPIDEEQAALMLDLCYTMRFGESSIDEHAAKFLRNNCLFGEEFDTTEKGERVTVGGEVIKFEAKKTAKQDDFANVDIAFEDQTWRVKLWQEQFDQFADMMSEGSEVIVSGKKDSWNGFESVVGYEVEKIEEIDFAAWNAEDEED